MHVYVRELCISKSKSAAIFVSHCKFTYYF